MKHSIPITFILLLMFASIQVIGIFVIKEYIDEEETQKQGEIIWNDLPSIAGVELERPELTPMQAIIFVVFALVAGTALFFLILRWKIFFLIKLWFFIAILLCTYITLGAFMPSIYSIIISFLLTSIKLWKPNILIHNVSELLLYPGLAVIFVPLLSLLSVFILLIILSCYDMYAVWKSKHMIALAKAQSEQNVFAGLSIPYKFPKKITKTIKKSETRTAILGGGDIGFPLLFTGVVLVYQGLLKAFLIIPFTTIALAVLFFLAEKNKFYPALPFLSIGCFTGYLLILLV
ncbi:hypothetical protein HYV79_03210 [Candidatus Woesearchaeota archaeon]|nr:hypothetical protein [Candidatus Woesearchaeota archaeon]